MAASEYFTWHEFGQMTSLGLNHFSQENTPETESQIWIHVGGGQFQDQKNGYVPLGTYQKNNLENFGGGPVEYSKKNVIL